MTVKITCCDENQRRVVRVDGWLTAGDVAAMEEAMEHDVRGTRIDLTDLRSADGAGRAALRALEARLDFGRLMHAKHDKMRFDAIQDLLDLFVGVL